MTEIRRIKLKTDRLGRPALTELIDLDTDEPIRNVYAIELEADPNGVKVVVTLAAEFVYEGPAEVKRVRVYEDGTAKPIDEEEQGEGPAQP